MFDQLIRSATSVGANLVKQKRFIKKDFLSFIMLNRKKQSIELFYEIIRLQNKIIVYYKKQ